MRLKYLEQLTHWPRPQTCSLHQLTFHRVECWQIWCRAKLHKCSYAPKFKISGQKCSCMFLSHIYIIYDKQYHMSSESNCPEYNECEFKQLLSKQVNIVLYCKNNLVCFCSVLLTKILPTAPQQNCFASPSNTAVFLNESTFWTNRVNEWLIKTFIFTSGSFSLLFRV